MARGKTYGIHDVQMRYNKDTDAIEILLPGNSSDPTKIISLPNGGGGGGFPVAGNELQFEGGEVDIAAGSPGITAISPNGFKIQVTEPGGETDAVLILEANASAGQYEGVHMAVKESLGFRLFSEDGEGPMKIAEYGADGAERSPAIDDAVDLATALVSLNALLQYFRDRGTILVGV
jgi:hypothetical protein